MSNNKESSYEYKHKTQGSCDPSYLAEFEQGNFVHAAMQTRYTGQELLKIFLYSDEISEEDKMKQLRYMFNKMRYIASDMDQEYDKYVVQNNNEVRENIRIAYQDYHSKDLRMSWAKFNNTRWKSEGGKSRQGHCVEYPDHEWHDRYLQKRKAYIKECVMYMLASKLRDPLEMVTEGTKYFDKGEYEEVVQNMDIVAYKKTKILAAIQQKYLSLSKR